MRQSDHNAAKGRQKSGKVLPKLQQAQIGQCGFASTTGGSVEWQSTPSGPTFQPCKGPGLFPLNDAADFTFEAFCQHSLHIIEAFEQVQTFHKDL